MTQAAKIHEALGLLNGMVSFGEQHSATSRKIVHEAFAALREMTKVVENVESGRLAEQMSDSYTRWTSRSFEVKNLDSFSQYENTYSYKTLITDHTLDETGVWEIYGEDPNCDLGGPHHEPHLCNAEGTLRDVIAYAVELPSFWQWGAGGRIKKAKAKAVVKVDAFAVENRRKKLNRIKELEAELKRLRKEV